MSNEIDRSLNKKLVTVCLQQSAIEEKLRVSLLGDPLVRKSGRATCERFRT